MSVCIPKGGFLPNQKCFKQCIGKSLLYLVPGVGTVLAGASTACCIRSCKAYKEGNIDAMGNDLITPGYNENAQGNVPGWGSGDNAPRPGAEGDGFGGLNDGPNERDSGIPGIAVIGGIVLAIVIVIALLMMMIRR